jgi:hypothetical protein
MWRFCKESFLLTKVSFIQIYKNAILEITDYTLLLPTQQREKNWYCWWRCCILVITVAQYDGQGRIQQAKGHIEVGQTGYNCFSVLCFVIIIFQKRVWMIFKHFQFFFCLKKWKASTVLTVQQHIFKSWRTSNLYTALVGHAGCCVLRSHQLKGSKFQGSNHWGRNILSFGRRNLPIYCILSFPK